MSRLEVDSRRVFEFLKTKWGSPFRGGWARLHVFPQPLYRRGCRSIRDGGLGRGKQQPHALVAPGRGVQTQGARGGGVPQGPVQEGLVRQRQGLESLVAVLASKLLGRLGGQINMFRIFAQNQPSGTHPDLFGVFAQNQRGPNHLKVSARNNKTRWGLKISFLLLFGSIEPCINSHYIYIYIYIYIHISP